MRVMTKRANYELLKNRSTILAGLTFPQPWLIPGCYFYHDVDYGAEISSGVVANVGQTAYRVLDRSGNGRHLLQNSAPSRAAIATVDGFRVLSFDGTDDYYDIQANLSGLAAGEIFISARLNAAPPATEPRTGLWVMAAGGVHATHYPYNADNRIYEQFGTSVRKDNIAYPAGALGAWHVYNVASQPSLWQAYINNGLVHNTTTNTVSFPATGVVGRSINNTGAVYYYFHGYVRRIALYSRILTAQERLHVYDSMAA